MDESAEIQKLRLQIQGLQVENEGLWKIIEALQEVATRMDDAFVQLRITKRALDKVRLG